MITKKYVGIELTISKSEQDENKKIFDKLLTERNHIENEFGQPLDWQRLDDKKMSRIAFKLNGANIFNKDEWGQMQEFLINNMIKFNGILKQYIVKIKQ